MGNSGQTSAPISPGSAEWFLDLRGRPSGPFSGEQIAGLLRDGEISPEQPVSSARLQGRSVAAAQIRAWIEGGAAQFDPPPRPEAVAHENLSEPTLSSPVADPTRDLFDTLQAVKEKRAASTNTQSPLEVQLKAPTRVPPQLGLLAALIAVFIGAIWGVAQLTSSPQEVQEVARDAERTEERTPSRAAAPVAASYTAARPAAPIAPQRPAAPALPARRFSLPERPASLASPPRPVLSPGERDPLSRARDSAVVEESREERNVDEVAREPDERDFEGGERVAVDKDPFAAPRSGDPDEVSEDGDTGGGRSAASADEEPIGNEY